MAGNESDRFITWDFGDALLPLTAFDAVHSYAQPGDYVVWLRAMPDCGCGDRASGSYSQTLTVGGQPVAPDQHIYLPLVLKRKSRGHNTVKGPLY